LSFSSLVYDRGCPSGPVGRGGRGREGRDRRRLTNSASPRGAFVVVAARIACGTVKGRKGEVSICWRMLPIYCTHYEST
jgi:hypothetical protein